MLAIPAKRCEQKYVEEENEEIKLNTKYISDTEIVQRNCETKFIKKKEEKIYGIRVSVCVCGKSRKIYNIESVLWLRTTTMQLLLSRHMKSIVVYLNIIDHGGDDDDGDNDGGNIEKNK